jgi:hypothetical protein
LPRGASGAGLADRRPSRVITTLAAGFLALDGVLLVLAGLWSERIGLMVWGVVFGAGAVAVVFYWRRYLRRLRELDAEIAARFRELEQLARGSGE